MVYQVTELNSPIPSEVTHLHFKLNLLEEETTFNLIRFFRSLPPTVTSLSLAWLFRHKAAAECVAILKSIPPSINDLNLSSNKLGQKKGDELIGIICAIGSTVTHLDLGYNQLGQKNEKELIALFNNIRPSVISLNLRGNALNKKDKAQLENISKALDVLSISCDDLSFQKYQALNRYKGYDKVKTTCQFLYSWLPKELSLKVLNYLPPFNENDFKNLLGMDLETKEFLMQEPAPAQPEPAQLALASQKLAPPELPSEPIQWFNQYSIGTLTAIVTAVVEAIIFFATHMTIDTILMWGTLVGFPIALGILAGFCFYLSGDVDSKQSDLSPI